MVKIISRVSAGKIRKGETINLKKKVTDYWVKNRLAEYADDYEFPKADVIHKPKKQGKSEKIPKPRRRKKAVIVARAKPKAEEART